MMEVKFGLNTKCFVIRTPPLHSAQDGFQNMLMWYPYIQNQLTVKETEAKNIILIQKQISKYLQPIYITFWIKFQPVFIFLSVFFFYRVFTDLRNTQQQQTVYLSICLLMYIPAAWPGFEEFLRGLYILCMSFFRIGLIFDASPPPVYVSLTNVIWREKRGGIYMQDEEGMPWG